MSTRLAGRAAGDGLIRFDAFVEEALYSPEGFYAVGGRAGRRGDFLTSPEVGPLFGAVLASWIDAEYARLGRPDNFRVVEVGAGPGTLARSILHAAPAWSGRYVAVERSAGQRELHPPDVVSTDVFPDDEVVGVVLANELLDNLPFRLAVFDGAWREAHVAVQRDGSLAEVLRPAPSGWAEVLPPTAAHGSRAPVQERAASWVASVRASLRGGSLLVFDYCSATTAALAAVPWRSWLRTYRGHDRGVHYLREVGSQDITCEVCLDQLPPADQVSSQAQFLQQWGITELVAEGRRRWEESASRPTLDALRMRSRVREAESLLDPSGLGGFTVAQWQK